MANEEASDVRISSDGKIFSGMAGKFPDSHDVYHFRDNLFNKVDMISGDFRRWKPLFPEVPQRTGKLFDIEKFDAGCFGRSFCVWLLEKSNNWPMC